MRMNEKPKDDEAEEVRKRLDAEQAKESRDGNE